MSWQYSTPLVTVHDCCADGATHASIKSHHHHHHRREEEAASHAGRMRLCRWVRLLRQSLTSEDVLFLATRRLYTDSAFESVEHLTTRSVREQAVTRFGADV